MHQPKSTVGTERDIISTRFYQDGQIAMYLVDETADLVGSSQIQGTLLFHKTFADQNLDIRPIDPYRMRLKLREAAE